MVINSHHVEELLIDFRELIGEHSGENMAEAVYNTLELYGLKEKVSKPTICHNSSYNSPNLDYTT